MEKLIGRDTTVSSLGNDEVIAKVLSPRDYRELVLPREQKLADFYKEGISHFHSCGNITPYLMDIQKIRGLKTVEISAWTDLKTAARILEKDITLEKWIHPEDLILKEEESRARFSQILEDDAERHMSIVCGGAVRDTIRWLTAVEPIIKRKRRF